MEYKQNMNEMNKQFNIEQISTGPKNHFFGFHDIPAWNFKGDKILALEIDSIDRPPLPGETANVGYINEQNKFTLLGKTNAFNYPQGARMQWIGKSDYFITNNQIGINWGSNIYNTVENKRADELPFPCHCLMNDEKTAYYINYSRLFRLGAYGYCGIIDNTSSEPLPKTDGIFVGDIKTKEHRLLISIADVAKYPSNIIREDSNHHYLTHLVLNPSNTRLAFLHRYFLPDGGMMTRLMTIGVDGSELKCLASGFLSHFDWKDDKTIFIFGRANSNLDSLRSKRLFSLPLVSTILPVAKKAIKLFIKKGKITNASFLLVSDMDNGAIVPIAKELIPNDGHPMFCLVNRDWIINDTYPDINGYRELMLYQFSQKRRIDIGKFKMISEQPDLTKSDIYFDGIDSKILKSIQKENLAFTRSGLHCDLHPRWDQKGEKISFDSIHMGTRQIYKVDVSKHII